MVDSMQNEALLTRYSLCILTGWIPTRHYRAMYLNLLEH